MADNTKIAWTNATWNVFVGCTKKSDGCKNCSAIRDANRLSHNPHPKIAAKYAGTVTDDGKNWSGRINFDEETLLLPLRWNRPRMIFVNYTSDTFHAGVPDEWIDRLFAVMAFCPQHTFQVLTKRADRMRDYINNAETRFRVGDAIIGLPQTDEWLRKMSGDELVDFTGAEYSGVDYASEWPLPNVWLIASVENQEMADERVPQLLQTPAAVRGLSVEPLLGPVDLSKHLTGHEEAGAWPRPGNCVAYTPPLDWVIVGGESGPGARPFHVAWARSVVRQCEAAGVPCFVKQLGARVHGDPREFPTSNIVLAPSGGEHAGYIFTLKDRKGGAMEEWPEDLRVRQFPILN